ncbi:alpha/beta hydrolase family protein [Acinetobacter sp. DSM 11652]|uniref:alpha/beta hydrolase family protein n=1 Tax=Acinetobacter sp. DSM 11652 TaxID=346222 RepID=UPI0008AF63AF|nr:alpha/beta fold hydrolase [Acinetobacter sp. DSM 11652]SEL78696.1 Predicted alpha/beta hydrolase [Acinetobacter sp. DSM 11652]
MQAIPNVNQMPRSINKTQVQFPALDNYMLTGTRYLSSGVKTVARIIVASATAVPQPFYRRFAEYAAERGFEVLTFDYRGVGASSPAQLKGFKMSYLDWGKLDLAGAIEYFSSDTFPLFVTAHSYGGQALGLTPNHHQVSAMCCYGTGAGWAGYMPFKERFKVSVMWSIVFPPIVAVTGYLPWSKFNMGSDLPLGVYQQWRRWCKNPLYFFADPEQQDLKAQYASVKTKIYAVSALDDDWALPNSRQAFMQHYRSADMRYIDITAKQYQMPAIGHMGYFKKGAEKIWDDMLQNYLNLVDD